MIEKERKFLLRYLPDGLISSKIEQGYLMFEGNKHLRVRIIDDKSALLTYKDVITTEFKMEYEFEIPIEKGFELMDTTNIKLTKNRYSTEYKGNHIDIDLYPDGKAIVEIEYETDTIEHDMIPDFCGEDVTNEKEYSNINIAFNNSKEQK